MSNTTKCLRPACYRPVKGLRGLNVHLRRSPRCTRWYNRLDDHDRDALWGSSYRSSATEKHPVSEQDVQNNTSKYDSDSFESVLATPVPWSTKGSSAPSRFGVPLGRFAYPRDDICAYSSMDDERSGGLGDIGDMTSMDKDISIGDIARHRIERHPTAGRVYGKGRTTLEEMDHDLSAERKKNIFHPFTSREDFEVAAWLSQSGVPMAHIDKFLKLPYIIRNGGLSFRSAQELNTKIALLPKTPPWKSRKVMVEGGSSKRKITLFYRDGLEVFKFCYGNPLYAGHQQNVPSRVWLDYENDVRIFSEPMTCDLVYEIQNKVGEGETLGLVMLGSDKTHLTTNYGDKHAHCVYLSVGNIEKDIRTKTSARCWFKIAEIPVVKFHQKDLQGVLTQRLYHQCMVIITDSLKKCSHKPALMVDANGDLRLVRTILLAHLADNPEQQLIACAAGDASPLSWARLKHLGLSTRQKLRTGAGTLKMIRKISLTAKPTSIRRYLTSARKAGLNGVGSPFWKGWKFADPSKFLAPDVLHQLHTFFWVHMMTWARKMLGDKEVDRRYMCLQKHVQRRHFTNGFTRFSQHTGREYRELQSSFLAVISDDPDITPGIMKAFRSLLDFFYYAQFDIHTTTTVKKMEEHLQQFHDNKHHLSAAGVRNGKKQNGEFKIRKLELMQHVGRLVTLLGSAPQFSTEQTEHCHKLLAKDPFNSTNKKDYQPQVCLKLDRWEKIENFVSFVDWKIHKAQQREATESGKHETNESVRLTPEAQDWRYRKSSTLAFTRAFLPDPIRDVFEDDIDYTPRNETTAFVLTCRVTYGDAPIAKIARKYKLSDLRDKIEEYLDRELDGGAEFSLVDCWDKVRLQLRDESGGVHALVPVLAMPPSDDLPLGLYNFVLVKGSPELNIPCLKGHYVAQIRLIFQPIFTDKRSYPYLVYVQPMIPAQQGITRNGDKTEYLPDESSGLYKISRLLDDEGSRVGVVVNLTDIWCPVDVVPGFGKACPTKWTADTAVENARYFYLNHFFDKVTYSLLR